MRRTVIIVLAIAFVQILWGQYTNPMPRTLPHTQGFDISHSSNAYPSGWVGWMKWGGSVYSVPLNDAQMITNSDASNATTGVHNYNGKIGWLGEAYTLAMAVDSQNKRNISVSFDVMTIRNPYNTAGGNTRICDVLLQYRLGTGDPFTTVANVYQNGTEINLWGTLPLNQQNRTVTLPAQCDNISYLQIRWVSTSGTGSGDRPSFAIDNVVISGEEIPPSVLIISQTSLDYESKVLHTITDQIVRITNNRAYPTSLTGIELSSTSSVAFSIHDTSAVIRNIDLEPGEYIDVTLRFKPTTLGDHTGQLRILEVSEPPQTVDLSGTGVAPVNVNFVLSDLSVDFGDIILFEETSHTISITNSGSDPGEINIALLDGDSEFYFADPFTLPQVIYPLQTWSFDIGYMPETPGPNNGMLHLSGSLSFDADIPLSGNGTEEPHPTIILAPDTIGKTMQEQSVSAEVIMILNTGTAPLDIVIDTDDIKPWLSLDRLEGTVPAGGSIPIVLSFNTFGVAPSPPGGYTDDYISQFTVNSNDPTNPAVNATINLTVTAMPVFVDFSATPTDGICPLAVSFTDLSRLGGNMATATITGWRWDFQDDGSIDSYVQNPVYTYNMPGLYTVKLTILTSTGGVYSEIKTDHIEASNHPPVVVGSLDTVDMTEDSTWGPYSAAAIFFDPDGHPLSFTGEDSDNVFISFTGSNFTLSPTANWSGTETISLTASDPHKGVCTHTITVNVAAVNDPPIIEMPDSLYFIRNSHLTVDFGDYINDPDNPDNQISIQIMSMGVAPILNVVYQANEPGALSAVFGAPLDWFGTEMFEVTANDHMRRAVYTKQFTMVVLEYFTVDIGTDVSNDIAATVYQYTGQTVNFRDKTLGNPDWFQWSFGDGNTSGVQNPSHAYLASGTYTVSLTLRNQEAGMQSTATYTYVNMFTFSGTPVYDVSTVQNWTDPSYNIFGDVTFDEDADIGDGDTDVELFIFSEEPVNILANVNMNRVTFRPPAGSQFWGGLHYGGGSQGSLHEINLIGALRPLRINGSNPQVFNLSITPADPDELIDDIGLEIEGDASPNLIDVEITNYRTGILVNGTGRNRATTPTLTNTRIRNSTQGSRNGHETTTGIRVTGDVNIHLNDVEIKDYSLGLSIENDESAYTTTPNLINTRILHSIEDDEIRNESDAIGLRISGNVAVSMTDVEISDVNVGIVMENGANSNRSTPTLTNTRIRNSTQGSRSGDAIGVSLSNIPSILMDDCEIDGFGNGMIIVGDDFRATSTPTLTNTRIRNSTQGSRSTSTGLSISGDVLLTMENCDIDDYDQGIRYIGDGSSPRAVSTPTLTNTRVRNSNQGSRSTSTGISLTDIPQIYIGGGLVEGYHTGIEISGGDVRAVSTPTLTNTRVRNSTQGSRTENVGIFLGTGVLGRVDYCTVEEARIGILIADGNGTILRRNKLKNCEIGIRGSGILPVLPIHQHVFILTDDYFMEHPTLNYRALDLYFPGPWVVSNNTISGYSKAITANNAVIAFVNNILWSSYNTQIPFELNNSMMEQNNNDIRYDGGIYPGSGNINADPMFIDPAIENFNLHYNSPCIDAGSLLTPRDADGTVSDIGAFAYLHQAEFKASTRFVTVGTTVDFFNQSIGHDHPVSITEWDLNNDQTIDSFNRNWSHQFNEPGWYDVRLRMSTGPLVDDVVYERYVVVQVYQLKPPTNLNVGINESIFQLEWDAVTHTTNDLPITVNYYLIYSSDDPEGVFRFRTFTEAPVTSYSEALSPSFQRRFYFVIGFSGSRRMLMDFIDRSPEIDLHDLNIAIPINDTVERRP